MRPTRLLPIVLTLGLATAGLTLMSTSGLAREELRRVHRPGAVHVDQEYDVTGLTIPLEEIHELLPKDAIPSLVDPKLESVAEASEWLVADDRIIVVTVGDETVGAPLKILNSHEIANLEIGGEPVAATY